MRAFTFTGGDAGAWRIVSTTAIVGETLQNAARLSITSAQDAAQGSSFQWQLSGITSNDRYVMRPEKIELVAKQQGLGRPEASLGCFIPIRKTPEWWALTQDERRAVFEEQSRHIAIGMRYLPEIARRLHHCRDLLEPGPFDFLTWFEYAPDHEIAFGQLLAELRASPEWRFVDREVEIRTIREP